MKDIAKTALFALLILGPGVSFAAEGLIPRFVTSDMISTDGTAQPCAVCGRGIPNAEVHVRLPERTSPTAIPSLVCCKDCLPHQSAPTLERFWEGYLMREFMRFRENNPDYDPFPDSDGEEIG